mgnify:CR=1
MADIEVIIGDKSLDLTLRSYVLQKKGAGVPLRFKHRGEEDAKRMGVD